MQQYGTARAVFGLVEFLCWAVIIVGGLAGIIGLAKASGGGTASLVGLSIAMPALSGVVLGLIGVVVVQTGRAGVDTATSTHEMLAIARKQLQMQEAAERGEERKAKITSAAGKSYAGPDLWTAAAHREASEPKKTGLTPVTLRRPDAVERSPAPELGQASYHDVPTVPDESAIALDARYRVEADDAAIPLERDETAAGPTTNRPPLFAKRAPAGIA